MKSTDLQAALDLTFDWMRLRKSLAALDKAPIEIRIKDGRHEYGAASKIEVTPALREQITSAAKAETVEALVAVENKAAAMGLELAEIEEQVLGIRAAA